MLDEEGKARVREILGDLLTNEKVLSMKNYIQHGNVTTYDHALNVAYLCYEWCGNLPHPVNERVLLRAAMLHDFFLYDWHVHDKRHRLHGFRHARFAAENAVRYLSVSEEERRLIESHMWPLNPAKMPLTREGWILTCADKYVSLRETFLCRRTPASRRKRKREKQGVS